VIPGPAVSTAKCSEKHRQSDLTQPDTGEQVVMQSSYIMGMSSSPVQTECSCLFQLPTLHVLSALFCEAKMF